MSKHTPGPWTFGHWGNDFWVGTQPNGLSGKVARVLWGMGEGVEEGRENARLIAAAPELLEALKWYADPQIYKPHPHGLAFEQRDLSYVARAAIAKAEGKS